MVAVYCSEELSIQLPLMLKNSPEEYGWLTKALHWTTALLVIGLFVLGFWMVELDYYSDWYQTAPFYHESFGILLILILAIRAYWTLTNQSPAALPTHSNLERQAAKIIKYLLWGLMLLIVISGFLISTADFRAINVFELFDLPPLFEAFDNQADLAGSVHKWLAYILVGLVMLHVLGAIKHHFIDKDRTLKRML